MPITISVDAKGLIKELEQLANSLPKQLGIVTWKTAKKGKSFIAKSVTEELAVTQKVIKPFLHLQTKKIGKTRSSLTLFKSKRMSLRHFKPKQTGVGVSYKISKRGGRQIIPHAFMGPKPGVIAPRLGGNVWLREGARKAKGAPGLSQRIRRAGAGPSPWGVFVLQKKSTALSKLLREEMRKQLAERLRIIKLKIPGVN